MLNIRYIFKLTFVVTDICPKIFKRILYKFDTFLIS